MQPVGAGQAGGVGLHGGTGRVRQDAQDLADGDGARRGRREAAHLVGLARGRHRQVVAQRRAALGLVARQIGQRQLAGVGRVLGDLVDDGLRHRALQQRGRATRGDAFQHLGQLGVLQHMAHRPGPAGGVVEVARGHRVLDEVLLVGQHGGEARADLEALLGELDGGLDQLRPG